MSIPETFECVHKCVYVCVCRGPMMSIPETFECVHKCVYVCVCRGPMMSIPESLECAHECVYVCVRMFTPLCFWRTKRQMVSWLKALCVLECYKKRGSNGGHLAAFVIYSFCVSICTAECLSLSLLILKPFSNGYTW